MMIFWLTFGYINERIIKVGQYFKLYWNTISSENTFPLSLSILMAIFQVNLG